MPSGSRPASRRPVTAPWRTSITEMRSAPVLATKARRPDGSSWMPTGAAPTWTRSTTSQAPTSTRTTSLPRASDASSSSPPGSTATRMGNWPTSSSRVTSPRSTLISDSVPASRFVT